MLALLKRTTCFLASAIAAARGLVVLLFCVLAFASQAAVTLLDTYYSPKNKERPVRSSTRYIILHTTEGPARGSGAKLQKNGEAHYMVDEAGRIYRIIDRKRVAYHCGLSMWNGLSSIDNYSIGIEVVGFHNKNPNAAQNKALKALLAELKAVYKLKDDKILTHSMVAYGAPNQWYKKKHRGRKRCGMRMALPSVRKNLGLFSKPSFDPDVKAKRLIVADKELYQLLFSKETVKKNSNSKATASQTVPDKRVASTAKPSQNKQTQSAQTPPKPTPTPVARSSGAASTADDLHEPVDEDVASARYDAKENAAGSNVIGPKRSAWDIARDAYNSSSTIYEFPDGTRKNGAEIANWKAMPPGTKVMVSACEVDGPEKATKEGDESTVNTDSATMAPMPAVSISESAVSNAVASALGSVLAADWNSARTIYVSPDGSYVRGDQLDAEKLAALSPDARVFNGYKVGGPITARNPAFSICGSSWNDGSTYYLFPTGDLVAGDKVDPKKIPPKTMVLYKE